MIVRAYENYFATIMIAVTPKVHDLTETILARLRESFAREFLIIWDWGDLEISRRTGKHRALSLDYLKPALKTQSDIASW
jgi:hypothetical protein